MLTFDARFTLRLTTKGERHMSDQWIEGTIKRIRDAEEEKKRRENFEYMREQKLGAAGFEMFSALQKHLTNAVKQINEKLGTKRLTFGPTRYDEMEIEGVKDTRLHLKFDDDSHRIKLYVSRDGHSSEESTIKLDFNEDGEVRFRYKDRANTSMELAESLIDTLIDLQLAEPKPKRKFSLDDDV